MDSSLVLARRRSSLVSILPICLVAAAVLVGCTVEADLGGALGTVHASAKRDPSDGTSSSGHVDSGSDAGACDGVYRHPCTNPASDAGLSSSSGWGGGADGGVASSSGWGGDSDGGMASSSGWGGDSDGGVSSSSGWDGDAGE